MTVSFFVSRLYHVSLLLAMLLLLCRCKGDKKSTKANTVEHAYTNALANETSPYLLQHAHNPVNWKPWGPEVLEEAKEDGKLLLVSIGYSSCHWCHVMEEETFEDEEVAKMMNANFVNVKVDREERPDVDQVYMTAVQLMTGNGGWPLNVIVLPNGKPLYGGTYHTKKQWIEVLSKISALYKNDPSEAEKYASMVAAGVAETNLIVPSEDFETLNTENLKTAVAQWRAEWDLQNGGDKGSQKFMVPTNLDFLMDYATLSEDKTVDTHITNTLDAIANGGVYDHLGGGLYRYSVDLEWKIPHFEKMLYDNAQAIALYSKAYVRFQNPAYKALVAETFDFLVREMRDDKGGFYAAMDADSEGEEGKFYVWKRERLQTLLGADFELFADYYSITENGEWEHGNYVLRKNGTDNAFLKKHGIAVSDFSQKKSRWKSILMAARNERTFPRIDDKIITSWNAMLISGLVKAHMVFGNAAYLEKAEAVFKFLETTCYQEGNLVHTYKEGSTRKEGFLEDYAFLIRASLDLYGVSLNERYLNFAETLTEKVADRYADASGMFRYTDNDALIAKIIKTDDGVIPSANSVMAHNLFRLGHLRYLPKKQDEAKKMLASLMPALMERPASYGHWAKLLLHEAYPFFEVAVVGPDAKKMTMEMHAYQVPNTIVVGTVKDSDLPLFKSRFFDDGTYVFVCKNSACKLPVKTTSAALEQLKNF